MMQHNEEAAPGGSGSSAHSHNSGSEGHPGTIEKLKLTNFMCHASLELKFNRKINIISGKKDSGKSAMMTAIMVVLGTYDKRKRLGDFVKRGESQAEIEISFGNEGEHACEPKRYGDSILLKKIIASNGVSTTFVAELREETRNRRSLQQIPEIRFRQIKKPELKNIMIALKIHVTNPFAFITLQTVLPFLNNRKRKMYECLQEGIGVKEAIKRHKGISNFVVDKCVILERELDNIWERSKRDRKIKESFAYIRDIKKEMIWASVAEQESALKARQNKLQKHLKKKKVREYKLRRIAKRQTELMVFESKIQKWKVDLTAMHSEHLYDMERIIEDSNKKVEASTQELQIIDRQMQLKLADLAVLKKENDSMVEELSRRLKQGEDELKLQKDLAELAILKDTMDANVVSLRNKARLSNDAVKEKKEEYTEAKTRYETERAELDQFKKQTGSIPTVYGSKMNEFLNAIDEATSQGKFKEKPIGPIGLHVRVKDPKWELAVENVLESEFNNFFCDNNEDRLVLEELCKKIMPVYNLTTVCSKFVKTVHDVKEYKAKSIGNCLNFMDALDVPLPEVMNHLIDQSEIESILLCPTFDEALNLMAALENVPHNCTQMFTQDGEQFFPAPYFHFYSSKITSIRYLCKNREEEVINAEHKLAVDAKHLTKMNDKLTELCNASQELKSELEKAITESQNAYEKELDLKLCIDASRKERHEVGQDFFAYLQKEIKNCESKINFSDRHREFVMENLNKDTVKKEEMEVQRKNVESDFRDVNTHLNSCQEKKIELENELSAKQTKEKFLHKKIDVMAVKEANLQKEIEVQTATVREAEATALQSCARIYTNRSVTTLQSIVSSCMTCLGEVPLNDELTTLSALEKCVAKLTTLEYLDIAFSRRKEHYNKNFTNAYLEIQKVFKHFSNGSNPNRKFDLVFNHVKRQLIIKLNNNPNFILECRETQPSPTSVIVSMILYLIFCVWHELRFPFFLVDGIETILKDSRGRKMWFQAIKGYVGIRKRSQYILLTRMKPVEDADPDITIFRLGK